MKYLII